MMGVNTVAMLSLTRPVHALSVQHQPGRPGHGPIATAGRALSPRDAGDAIRPQEANDLIRPQHRQRRKRTRHSTLSKRGVYDVPRPVTQDASTGFAKAVTTGEGFTTSGTLRLRSASAAANSRSGKSQNTVGLACSHRTGAGVGIARVNSPSSGDIPQEKQGVRPSRPHVQGIGLGAYDVLSRGVVLKIGRPSPASYQCTTPRAFASTRTASRTASHAGDPTP
jgi:hypothetical protein